MKRIIASVTLIACLPPCDQACGLWFPTELEDEPKIKQVSETVTLPGGRLHKLRSCVLDCRTDGLTDVEVSPNGRYLLLGFYPPNSLDQLNRLPRARLFLIDLHEGKLLKELNRSSGFGVNFGKVAFSPDSLRIAIARGDEPIEVINLATTPRPLVLEKAQSGWLPKWSPDGALLACAAHGPRDRFGRFIDVWNSETGKKLSRLETDGHAITRFVFSADGNMILTTHGENLRLWEARTGKHLGQTRATGFVDGVSVRRSPSGNVALFPRYPMAHYRLKEGKTGGKIVLSNKTDKEVLRIISPAPDWPVQSAEMLDLSNCLVARAHQERGVSRLATLQFWNLSTLSGQMREKVAKLSQQELEQSWVELAERDSCKSRTVLKRLLNNSDSLGSFLEERIKPVPALQPDQLRQHIEDLNSIYFRTRETAEQALTDLGDLAVTALQLRVGQDNCPLELRRRGERILKRVREDAVSGEMGRMLWIVELLELWGTEEAKGLLKKLATGAPNAWITLEAQASLNRLTMASK